MCELLTKCRYFDNVREDPINPSSEVNFDLDVDPDTNFFNAINTNCKYYTENNLKYNKDKGLSLIHFNARSLKKNLNSIEHCINSLPIKFDIIAISENWLDSRTVDLYNLNGYEVTHILRNNKIGGGCSIYVHKSIEFKIVKSFCFSFEDEFECCTVKLCVESNMSIYVCCMYRAPGTKVDSFNCKLTEILQTLTKKKSVYICGDININVLNSERHIHSQSFIDVMYNFAFYALINKPKPELQNFQQQLLITFFPIIYLIK